MQSTPPFLADAVMPIYKAALLFAFMLGIASVLTGFGYSIFTFIQTDISISAAIYSGFFVFLKGAVLTAFISFIGFLAFWKKHQIQYNNCKASPSARCNEIGFFNFA